jgi:hypothetical protein
MTFELVRMGWPNTAAILILAVMPVIALAAPADLRPQAIQARQIEAAAVCPTTDACGLAATATTDIVAE